ncbi:MAG: transcription antitermination factor NusB [Sphaerochaetaceae bacterium]|nr:transcription antitermination factor NusB [Sphaerochaetaceae bacterium]
MATRTQARESVIGLLFAYDLGNTEIAKFSDELLEDKKIRNKQKDFAMNLFDGVIENLEVIDSEIGGHLNDRGLDGIGSVEKSILRLAVHEIMFTSLDKPVAINEAIELTKKLAGDSAPKFINGVLDKIEKKK